MSLSEAVVHAVRACAEGNVGDLRTAYEHLHDLGVVRSGALIGVERTGTLMEKPRTEGVQAVMRSPEVMSVLRSQGVDAGANLLHIVCGGSNGRRCGGAGADGWLGCLLFLLERAAETEINDRTVSHCTPLINLAFGGKPFVESGDTPDITEESESQQLAGLAALLACGADATLKHNVHRIYTHSHNRGDVARLLETAALLGGREAVKQMVYDRSSGLGSAPGWLLVTALSQVKRLTFEGSMRVLIAQWSADRKKRRGQEVPRDQVEDGDGHAYGVLRGVWSGCPRSVLAEVLGQLSP